MILKLLTKSIECVEAAEVRNSRAGRSEGSVLI